MKFRTGTKIELGCLLIDGRRRLLRVVDEHVLLGSVSKVLLVHEAFDECHHSPVWPDIETLQAALVGTELVAA
jgi:hypothetical protein